MRRASDDSDRGVGQCRDVDFRIMWRCWVADARLNVVEAKNEQCTH